MPRPIELRGKKGLVFGGGGIGVNVAERLVAFGVEVSIVDNELVNMFSFVKNQYFVDQISEAVGSADAVICCAPLTTKTHKIFDKHLIARFKKGSYFINVSRGKLADTEALLYGLDREILAGVGLDVTDPEPLPKKHELMNYKNVIISGHTAGLSEHNRERSRKLIIKTLNAFWPEKPSLTRLTSKQSTNPMNKIADPDVVKVYQENHRKIADKIYPNLMLLDPLIF